MPPLATERIYGESAGRRTGLPRAPELLRRIKALGGSQNSRRTSLRHREADELLDRHLRLVVSRFRQRRPRGPLAGRRIEHLMGGDREAVVDAATSDRVDLAVE